MSDRPQAITNGTPNPLDLGPPNHIGIVVRSIEEASARLALFGMKAGEVWDVEVPCTYLGVEGRAAERLAFVPLGPLLIELVQPTAGASPFASFLEKRGEGVEHIGYRVDDIEATLARAQGLGIAAEWLVSDGHGLAAAFFAGEAFFGTHIEVVRTNPPVSLESWRK